MLVGCVNKENEGPWKQRTEATPRGHTSISPRRHCYGELCVDESLPSCWDDLPLSAGERVNCFGSDHWHWNAPIQVVAGSEGRPTRGQFCLWREAFDEEICNGCQLSLHILLTLGYLALLCRVLIRHCVVSDGGVGVSSEQRAQVTSERLDTETRPCQNAVSGFESVSTPHSGARNINGRHKAR